MDGYFREQQIRYLTTVTHINAIMVVGGAITAAVSGSGQSPNNEGLSKSLKELQGLLLPEDVDASAEKAAQMLELLQSEVAKGPLIVRPVGVSHKPKKKPARRGK